MPEAEPLYLDHAATTPVEPEVVAAMLPYLQSEFANPAALYASGGRAQHAVEEARAQVVALVGAASPEAICFTSGGTESNNWAIQATAARRPGSHFIASAIEHDSVLGALRFIEKAFRCQVTYLPVDCHGMVSPETLRTALRHNTALVSIMHANNEVGTIEPVAELAAVAHERGALFHTDAVQTTGKIPLDVAELGVDFLSLSAHKLGGPKGVGALYVRQGARLGPLLHGGSQESGRRAGTLNVPGIVGQGAAAALAQARMQEDAERERDLVERLWEGLSAHISDVQRNGHPDARVPHILNVSIPGAEAEALVLRLDAEGIQVGSGSACASREAGPSHVLAALGVSPERARCSVRLSLGRTTTVGHVDRVVDTLQRVVERLRATNPTWDG